MVLFWHKWLKLHASSVWIFIASAALLHIRHLRELGQRVVALMKSEAHALSMIGPICIDNLSRVSASGAARTQSVLSI